MNCVTICELCSLNIMQAACQTRKKYFKRLVIDRLRVLARISSVGESVERVWKNSPKKVGNAHFPNSPLAWDDYIIRCGADLRYTLARLSMRGQESIGKVEMGRSEGAGVRQQGKENQSEAR